MAITKALNTQSAHPIPLVTLKEGVIYPQTEAILAFTNPSSIIGVNNAVRNNNLVCFVSQKVLNSDPHKLENLYSVGTVVRIKQTVSAGKELHALVKGLYRVNIFDIQENEQSLTASVTQLPEQYMDTKELLALSNHVINQIKKALNLGKGNIDPASFVKIINASDPVSISYQIASTLLIKNKQKQEILQENNLEKRLTLISGYLSEEIKILQLERKIASKTEKKFDKNMREHILRERMRTIQQELGSNDEDQEIQELRKKLKKVTLPKKVALKIDKELSRLAKVSIHSPEYSYIRTWIEAILELPWGKLDNGNFSLAQAKKILNQDHYGLKQVKERILEHIAVLKLKSKQKKSSLTHSPTILCFTGPPGVGKTSVGKSIAKALKRKFVKMSLGGMRDEAEIRGHRRTYVGAMPGRIVQLLKEAGTMNPVFMFDEIDKIGADFRGDPASALLEVLDPEQNSSFRDNYLDIPFDLSNVLFITTANVLSTIPSALYDRLEIIQFTGYTEDEKLAIAKKYLMPKQIKNHALLNKDLKLSDAILKKIICFHTREAGVRDLERQIATVLRKVAKEKVSHPKKLPIKISTQKLAKFLGPNKFSHTLPDDSNHIGIINGLAYTQAGGDILHIEVALMPGEGKISLTGQLGDVMKESAQASYSYVRSHQKELGITQKQIANTDIHIHVPEGAVPKDGPSAGLAITTAIISAFLKKPIRKNLAMTGEVTLRGRALEIGGVKEKVIAGHRGGIKEIVLPKFNKKNLIDIPAKVKKDLKFHYVSNMNEVVKIIFPSKK